MFENVPKQLDVPALERDVMEFWKENNIEARYLARNQAAAERFSFIDGPITANGSMGVHHAWGRSYKDLWQRYNTMLGKRQRYQNGFDCQGLWVEVTVEKKLGFTSKRDIEKYGIARFVRECKADVYMYADLMTRQTQRLGNFMDWENSYFTLSDDNNYSIWYFLQRCHERGLIYQGTDVMPWCTRCATGLSEHEITTDGYQLLTHRSVFVRFPLVDRPDESLLVWTTTPWTLTSNVAVAVNPELPYLKIRQGDNVMYLAKGAISALKGDYETLAELTGQDLFGWSYNGPFDELPVARGVRHTVIAWEDVTADEGTGLVHIAPGCGKEDFALGKKFGLAVIAPLDQYGVYGEGFDWLTGRNVQGVATDIIENLRVKGILYREHDITHRYPTCWRCATELVFRLVDEWFISMDPLRDPMMKVVRKIRWLPPFGMERELDWLLNMDDWMISKKRYWGLALPFWICPDGHLQVIGSKAELFQKALSGLDELESPHRPWIDAVHLPCDQCGQIAERIPDVGNPWLDAGIVPYSTLHYDTDREYWRDWFPANFITEGFPGQFRNWFYSMLAMSTVLENSPPFETVLGYASVLDQTGREMHKSWGNLIPFDEAADRAGADTMRWLFAQHNPEQNLNFGWESLDSVKRRLLILWNTYSFFVTYANVDGWSPNQEAPPVPDRTLLDRWVLARLAQLVAEVRASLDKFDAMAPARAIDLFIEDLSTWYVRRSRRRFWRSENDSDKLAAYATLYECLVTVASLLAPFMPFLAENLYQNLVASTVPDAASSVHLTDFPVSDQALVDHELLTAMDAAQEVVALGRAVRDRAAIKVRQPLSRMYVALPSGIAERSVSELRDIILDELNVKELEFANAEDDFLEYVIRPNLPVLGPRFGKRLNEIKSALAALDPAGVVRSIQAGSVIQLGLNGETIELQPEDVVTSAREREGFAAMAGNGYLVALETELTEELVQEGLARELVRHMNDWRKTAGFSIDDRISVRYQTSGRLKSTLQEYAAYIQQETLASSLQDRVSTGRGFEVEETFGEERLRMEMERT